MAQTDSLSAWCRHGLSKDGKMSGNGEEYFTDCPFCVSEGKFYVNIAKQVFDCKVCGERGSFLKFLEKIHEMNKAMVQPYHVQALATEKGLPLEAFEHLELGWNQKGFFTIPVYSDEGKLCGLDMYSPGGSEHKIYHTAHPAQLSLYNAQKLKNHLNGNTYICEGLWDAIALEWLLKNLEQPGLVVSVPGANTNLGRWEHYFYDKDVVTLYDNDKAGQEGEFKAYGTLDTKTRTTSYVHWPADKPIGFDVRDHVKEWMFEKKDAKKGFELIKKWLYNIPRSLRHDNKTVIGPGVLTTGKRENDLYPIKWEEVIDSYQDLLYMPDITPIKIVLGTILANRYRGEMVWMFLVAPPSSGKSELIMSLGGCEKEIENISTVTENTFVSGYIGEGGSDKSLLLRLKNRAIAVKDFTPMLQAPKERQQQVFGVLRDAYDGSFDGMYGHGSNRRYKDLHFGIIGGVTAVVEMFGNMQQALGERFLRYYMPIKPEDKKHIEAKAEKNLTYDKIKRANLQLAVRRFLELDKELIVPERPKLISAQLSRIAEFTVAMRTTVPKDFKERMMYSPPKEGSTRVFKQMSMLAMGLARLEKKTVVGLDEVNIIKQVALSTCPDIVKKLVRVMWDKKLPLTLMNLEEETGFPVYTLKFQIADLQIIGLVNRVGTGFKTFYTLSDRAKSLIEEAQIYAISTKKRFIIGR